MAHFFKHLASFFDVLFDRLGGWANRLIPMGAVILMLISIPHAVREMRPAKNAPPHVFWPDPNAERITFSSDTLFEFNESKLTDEGRIKIQKTASDLSASSHGGMIVVGHTDRLGDAVGNKRLSTARARAVRDELVKIIPTNNVAYIGIGSQSPLTANGECPGKRQDSETLKCNAKDRRVEIWLKPE